MGPSVNMKIRPYVIDNNTADVVINIIIMITFIVIVVVAVVFAVLSSLLLLVSVVSDLTHSCVCHFIHTLQHDRLKINPSKDVYKATIT